MVKNFIHILRTYLITFRYLKKFEINQSQFFSLIVVYSFIIISAYFFFISLIN